MSGLWLVGILSPSFLAFRRMVELGAANGHPKWDRNCAFARACRFNVGRAAAMLC